MRPSRLVLTVAVFLAAAAVAGCGSSGDDSSGSTRTEKTATAATPEAPPGASVRNCEGTVAGTEGVRVTGIGCGVARGVVAAWAGKAGCSSPSGSSRLSCAVYRGYRCLGTVTDRGVSVSCSRPGSSIAFLAHRG